MHSRPHEPHGVGRGDIAHGLTRLPVGSAVPRRPPRLPDGHTDGRRMRTSEKTSAVFDAIVKAQAALDAVPKDKTAKIPTKSGGSFSYNYASLDTVIEHVHGVLAANGLAVVQEPTSGLTGLDGLVGVYTTLVHTSGE